MVSTRCELKVHGLPIAVRRRFSECIAGRAAPRPLWSSPAVANIPWKALLGAGLAILVVMAVIDGDHWLDWPWLAGWGAGGVALGWGLFGWLEARKLSAGLPFPAGTYVFATDCVEARNGKCFIRDLETLSDTRVRSVYEGPKASAAELQLVFGRELVSLRLAGKQTATQLKTRIDAARQQLLEAQAARDWNEIAALDPLYPARYGEDWAQLCVSAVEKPISKAWFGLSKPALAFGALAGLALAPALWYGSNLERDGAAYSQALSTNTVVAWKRYIGRAEAQHRQEALDKRLPAAAWKAAKNSGSIAEVWKFLASYGSSENADEARTFLHAMYVNAASAAAAKTSPTAQPQIQNLLEWLEANHSDTVELRFGQSSEAWLSTVDDLLEALRIAAGARFEIPPMAKAFSEDNGRHREDAIAALVREGFGNLFPRDLVRLERGGRFSASPRGFEKPALAITCDPHPLASPVIDPARGRLYLSLGFHFEVSLVVPGKEPATFPFEIVPIDYIPDSYSEHPLYEHMAEVAYDELHQRIASLLCPSSAPQRAYALTKVVHQRWNLPETGGSRPGVRGSATAFFISEDGCLVTARHFTDAFSKYRVEMPDGPVEAKLLAADPAHDLALLKIERKAPAFLSIRSSSAVQNGEDVWTVGFPKPNIIGMHLTAGQGVVSGLKGFHDDDGLLQVTVPVQEGNSGGPLLDANGNVIGVINGKLTAQAFGSDTPQNVNYAVKSDLLLSFLKSQPRLQALPPARVGDPQRSTQIIEMGTKATVRIEGD